MSEFKVTDVKDMSQEDINEMLKRCQEAGVFLGESVTSALMAVETPDVVVYAYSFAILDVLRFCRNEEYASREQMDDLVRAVISTLISNARKAGFTLPPSPEWEKGLYRALPMDDCKGRA